MIIWKDSGEKYFMAEGEDILFDGFTPLKNLTSLNLDTGEKIPFMNNPEGYLKEFVEIRKKYLRKIQLYRRVYISLCTEDSYEIGELVEGLIEFLSDIPKENLKWMSCTK